jgi:hypothetical protein
MTASVSDIAIRIVRISEISFTHIRCVLEADRGNMFVSKLRGHQYVKVGSHRCSVVVRSSCQSHSCSVQGTH